MTTTPTSTYTNPNGKTVQTYTVAAETYESALAAIPGDFLVVGHTADDDAGTYTVDVVRTF
jgi:hypothetical protein